jgi:hypothetical protein
MGWWSTAIMGGDTPLDFEDLIYDICGVDKWPEGLRNMGVIDKDLFELKLPKILKKLSKEKNTRMTDYYAIGHQVLGAMMMERGFRMHDDLKKTILEASSQDEWAGMDDDRKANVDGFEKAIKEYDGTPIKLKSKGLFEVIAEKLN